MVRLARRRVGLGELEQMRRRGRIAILLRDFDLVVGSKELEPSDSTCIPGSRPALISTQPSLDAPNTTFRGE